MKRFTAKLLLFLFLVGGGYGAIQYRISASSDVYYWKATGTASSIVLGGSRAKKGLVTFVLKEELGLEEPFINFAFNGAQSPYGYEYMSAIKRKIGRSSMKSGERRFFVLSVCPGNIMDFGGERYPREKDFAFFDLWNLTMHPNLEYLFRNPRGSKALMEELVEGERQNNKKIFRDGTVLSFASNKDQLKQRQNHKRREKLIRYELIQSDIREAALSEIISWLSEYGYVVLVRLPVSPLMLKEENEACPGFDKKMAALAEGNSKTKYFNYTTPDLMNKYLFFDGNHHLEGNSAIQFSADLSAKMLQEYGFRAISK